MCVFTRNRRESSSRVKALQCKDKGFCKLRGLASEISSQIKREFRENGIL